MASHIFGATRFGAGNLAIRLLAGTFLLSSTVLSMTVEASALSEIKQEQIAPPTDETVEKEPLGPVDAAPSSDPSQSAPSATEEPEAPADEDMENGGDETTGNQLGRPEIDPNAPLPEIIYDVERLPEPVKRMRNLILEAAKSGDIEALRPLIGKGTDGTLLALGGVEGDPIEFLREGYRDSDGQELLAILEEVLNAGYVHLDAGKPEELYVWPYFVAVPLERLDSRQRVELFKIVTAFDYEEMKASGAYTFYRTGISPDGHWEFFVAGD
ncbi:MAG TPA: hypothetical protein VNS34_11780 [Rhizobiaceae bacterium]|nr:hypothetical protein [Rhizobiaceae bacterium]